MDHVGHNGHTKITADVGGGSPSPVPLDGPVVPPDTYMSPKTNTWEDNKGAVNDGRYFHDNGDTNNMMLMQHNNDDSVGPSPPSDLKKQSSVVIDSIMAQDAEDKDDNLNSIFLFGSPAAYFKAVEAILLLQCFYISIAATQVRLYLHRYVTKSIQHMYLFYHELTLTLIHHRCSLTSICPW